MQNRQQMKQQADRGRRFAAHLRRCTAAFQPALMPLMVASALAAIVDNLLAHETLDGEQVVEIVQAWLG